MHGFFRPFLPEIHLLRSPEKNFPRFPAFSLYGGVTLVSLQSVFSTKDTGFEGLSPFPESPMERRSAERPRRGQANHRGRHHQLPTLRPPPTPRPRRPDSGRPTIHLRTPLTRPILTAVASIRLLGPHVPIQNQRCTGRHDTTGASFVTDED